MNTREFVAGLAVYYREPALVEGKPNIRITALEHWLKTIPETELEGMFNKTVSSFVPTNTNQFPLIPHIIEICEIQTTDKSKTELARTTADRIIWAYLNIGCRENGCKERAKEYIGGLGIAVLKQTYGQWYKFCDCMERESIEIVRSHLRDSIIAYINRAERGIQDQAPELTDLAKPKIHRIGTGQPMAIGEIQTKRSNRNL